MNGGMSPEAAADKAFKRIEEIFSKYPIAAKLSGQILPAESVIAMAMRDRLSSSTVPARPAAASAMRYGVTCRAASRAPSTPGRSPSSSPISAVFLAFVVYPVFYGVWMGSEPTPVHELLSDPIYQSTW